MVQTRAQRRRTNANNASISRLSPELLYMIFAWFCPHCHGDYVWPLWANHDELSRNRKQDACAIFNLCLVSSQFRTVAQEVMYHTFDPCNPFVHHDDATWQRRLEPFLCTLISRPDLAQSVRAACLEPAMIARLDFSSALDAAQLSAKAFGLPGFLREDNFFDNGSHLPGPRPLYISVLAGELLTFLVALLPNLQHLRVDSIMDEIDLSIDTTSLLGLTELPLRTLDTGLPLERLLSIAPHVETMINRGRGNYRWSKLSSIKSLVIDSTHLDVSDIRRGVVACNGHISHFSYQGVNLKTAEVIQALNTPKLHNNLEVIHIDGRRQMSGMLTYRVTEPIYDLKKFASLQTLLLTISSIYGGTDSEASDSDSLVRILPFNVTSLTLVGDEKVTPRERLYEGLIGLARAKPSLFKRLRQIRCTAGSAFEGRVKDTFEKVGVNFSYQEFPRSDWGPLHNSALLQYEMLRISPCRIGPLPGESDDDEL